MATTLIQTRKTLHRVATHVLGRRRYQETGHFGLRVAPGGFATPAFGPEPEVLRVSGPYLVREVGGTAGYFPMLGAHLGVLAEFADADLDREFSAGADTPPLGDVDAPLDLDGGSVALLVDWWVLGAEMLDQVVGIPFRGSGLVGTAQLWPEHFDLGATLDLEGAGPVTLGFSPGDDWQLDPYCYVSPSGEARPGDPAFWNAPFGAFFTIARATAGDDPAEACRGFLEEGLERLTG